MFGLFSLWGTGKPFKNYPNLADNTVASPHYEIKKLIDGPINAVFLVRGSGHVVALAGGYLWKINPQGELVDTFYVPSGMFSSGIVFADDYYIDWVFSGDKTKKKYAEQINANNLSEQELAEQLNRAEQLEFSLSDTPGKRARAYLRAGNKAWILDMSQHVDRVDDHCRGSERIYEELYWEQTCLQGYTKKPEQLVYLENRLSQAVTPVGFDRKHYFFREGVAAFLLEQTLGRLLGLGGGSTPYWFGTGYFQLKHQQEILNFSAFADNSHQRINLEKLALFDPASHEPADFKIMTRSYRNYPDAGGEKKLTPYYEKELGLYVVRKKVPAPKAVLQRPWLPHFTGKGFSVRAVSGDVTIKNSTAKPYHYWVDNRQSRPSAYATPRKETQGVMAPFYELPQSMSLQWRMYSSSPLYQLKFAGQVFAGLGHDDEDSFYPHLNIQFDPAEIAAAFQRFEPSSLPVQLEISIEETELAESQISIALRDKKVHIPLKNIQFKMAGKAIDLQNSQQAVSLQTLQALYEDAETRYGINDETFRVTYEAARSQSSALTPFLEMAKQKANDPLYLEKNASLLTFYYTELLNTYNMAHEFEASSVLVMHFAKEIFPKVGKDNPDNAYNLSVIASQSLAFAQTTKNQPVIQFVLKQLLGGDFDPSTHTNGTLLFNLACYYATQHNKAELLPLVKYARKRGKSAEQFMSDRDFKDYWQDADFLAVVDAKHAR